MSAYKANELLLKQQSSTKAHEAQLLDARRQRKETDEQLQAMMNRIAFLAQEELRLDRDIEAARRRAAEALAKQATRDQDIAATAKEVLAVLPTTGPPKLRPHTGRSSLLASLSDGASVAASTSTSGPPSAANSLRGSMASHPSTRSLDSSASHTHVVSPQTPPGSGAPGATGPGPGATGLLASGGGGGGCGGGASQPSGHPPRAPSASRSRPPVLAGRAADKLNKLPPVPPLPGGGPPSLRSPSPSGRPGSSAGPRPSIASRPGSATRSRPSTGSPPASACSSHRPSSSSDSTSAAAAAAPSPRSSRLSSPPAGTAAAAAATPHPRPPAAATAAAGSDLPPPLLAGHGAGHASGLQQLSGPSAAGGGGGGFGVELYGDLAHGAAGCGGGTGGSNSMTVLHAAADAAAELEGEVLEELQGGSRAAGAGGGTLAGLQEFATEGAGGRRVVQVKASRKAEGATVSAAGVGWGMGGRGGGPTAATTLFTIPPREAKQLQAEMAKKQQIWKVRKTFGLEPTPLSDRSAQVEEVGAGAWQ